MSGGSADRNVWIWEVENGEAKYIFPGHKGRVNGDVSPRSADCG